MYPRPYDSLQQRSGGRLKFVRQSIWEAWQKQARCGAAGVKLQNAMENVVMLQDGRIAVAAAVYPLCSVAEFRAMQLDEVTLSALEVQVRNCIATAY